MPLREKVGPFFPDTKNPLLTRHLTLFCRHRAAGPELHFHRRLRRRAHRHDNLLPGHCLPRRPLHQGMMRLKPGSRRSGEGLRGGGTSTAPRPREPTSRPDAPSISEASPRRASRPLRDLGPPKGGLGERSKIGQLVHCPGAGCALCAERVGRGLSEAPRGLLPTAWLATT